jgi:hypothetical protein
VVETGISAEVSVASQIDKMFVFTENGLGDIIDNQF